jgi:prepilin-type N-terminal cleavage/methylation domain-containing protein
MPTAHITLSSYRRTRRQARGFTMMELIVVIVISGALAAVVLPRFDVAIEAGDRAYADSVKAGLRYARSIAVGHRRLVCVEIDASSRLIIKIAPTNPAVACTVGIDGNEVFATPPGGVTLAWSTGGTGMVYFQPNGRVTSDAAGATGINRTLTITGKSVPAEAPINLEWFGRVE